MRVTVKRKSRIPRIIKAIATAKRRILFRQSGLILKLAKQRIKKGRKPTKRGRTDQARLGKEISSPGQSPMYHGSNGLKRTLKFHVDVPKGRATIGFERGKNPSIPKALERGGTSRTKNGMQRVKARPTMRPAFKAAKRTMGKIVREEFRKALR